MKQKTIEIPFCSLTLEHRLSYLYASAKGKRENSETCKLIWKQILAESKAKQYNKILFNRKLEGIGKVSEIREFIAELAKSIDGEYIAFIDENPEHFQTNRLTEMSASNLGLNVKFFCLMGEAKEWLLLK